MDGVFSLDEQEMAGIAACLESLNAGGGGFGCLPAGFRPEEPEPDEPKYIPVCGVWTSDLLLGTICYSPADEKFLYMHGMSDEKERS